MEHADSKPRRKYWHCIAPTWKIQLGNCRHLEDSLERIRRFHGRRVQISVLYSEEDINRRGVALILNKQAQKALLGYNTISPRLITTRFQTQTVALTVIQVYAPNMADREEMVDEFYDQLQQTIDDTPFQDIVIVQGDLNAKVGRDWNTWKNVIGHFGYGEMNNRGEKLLNLNGK